MGAFGRTASTSGRRVGADQALIRLAGGFPLNGRTRRRILQDPKMKTPTATLVSLRRSRIARWLGPPRPRRSWRAPSGCPSGRRRRQRAPAGATPKPAASEPGKPLEVQGFGRVTKRRRSTGLVRFVREGADALCGDQTEPIEPVVSWRRSSLPAAWRRQAPAQLRRRVDRPVPAGGGQHPVGRRNIHYEAPKGQPLLKAVEQNYTDSILLALPIVARTRDGGGIVIDLGQIYLTDSPNSGWQPR